MTKTAHAVAVAMLLFMLSACCSPGVKPEDANLLQASCGVASGEYERNLNAKQKQLDESKQEYTAEKQRSLALESTLVARQSEYKSVSQELAALENENHIIGQQIDTLRVTTEKEKALKAEYSKQLQKLNAEIRSLQEYAAKGSDDEYLVRLEALKQEVQTLRAIVLGQ